MIIVTLFPHPEGVTVAGQRSSLYCDRHMKLLRKVSRELECLEKKREECDVEDDFGERDGGDSDHEFGRPILLQHFPLHRRSDSECTGEDAAHPDERDAPFRIVMRHTLKYRDFVLESNSWLLVIKLG